MNSEPSDHRTAAVACLLASLAFAGWVHGTWLDWGLPSQKRAERLFASAEELGRRVPAMIEQRRRYYEMVESVFDPKTSFDASYRDLVTRWQTPLFAALPEDLVLDRMRNYLIGVNVSDEQMTLTAIAGLNPKRLDFVPGPLGYYGGFYYYTAAACLVLGKAAGWVTLNPGAEYYFAHPEETRRMYVLVRAVNAVSILSTLLAVFFIARRFGGWGTAAFSVLFFATFPLLVPFSHLSKAHIYGGFWLACSLWFCGKILEPAPHPASRRDYALAGAALGLCAGSIITNLTAGILLFFTEWIREDWNFGRALKSRGLWLAAAAFLGVFAAANFYIFLNFDQFRRLVRALNEFAPAITSVRWGEWPPYLLGFFTEQVHWSLAPFLAAGVVFAVKEKNRFGILCALAAAALFIHNLVMMRHPPINLRLLPFLAILAGWGAAGLLERFPGWKRAALAACMISSVVVSALQSDFYRDLHRDPSNLDLAGDWINREIPKGSSIGAWGGGFSPFDFPSIRFLDYELISIPHPADLDSSQPVPGKMPEYLVLTQGYSKGEGDPLEASRFISSRYREVIRWEGAKSIPGFRFESNWIRTGNNLVRILKKES